MRNSLIIGVCGGSAAGKSLFAQHLQKLLKTPSSILSQDRYYKDIGPLTPEERVMENFDHPDAIDHDQLVRDLDMFRSGKSINIPLYDFVSCCRTGFETIESPPPLLLLEGLFLLCVPEIVSRLDFSVFIDSSETCRVERIVARDLATRGRTEETVRQNLERYVLPMHNQFIQAFKDKASAVVENNVNKKEHLHSLVSQVTTQILDQFPFLGPK
jgi:uridine kinase